jgi:hypothetical protein
VSYVRCPLGSLKPLWLSGTCAMNRNIGACLFLLSAQNKTDVASWCGPTYPHQMKRLRQDHDQSAGRCHPLALVARGGIGDGGGN